MLMYPIMSSLMTASIIGISPGKTKDNIIAVFVSALLFDWSGMVPVGGKV